VTVSRPEMQEGRLAIGVAERPLGILLLPTPVGAGAVTANPRRILMTCLFRMKPPLGARHPAI
jgi:hypothetical protein